MTTDTGFTFQAAMGEICKGVIETVAERPGESDAKRFIRQQTAVYAVMSFMPRDPLETMLAGHCVIFDHLLRDGARDSLRGQPEEIKLRARPQINASGKMFLAHLDKFKDMQARLVDNLAFQPATQDAAPAEPTPARTDAPPPQAAHAPDPAPTGPAAAAPVAAPAGAAAEQSRPATQPAPSGQPAPRPTAGQPAAHPAPVSAQTSAGQPADPSPTAARTAGQPEAHSAQKSASQPNGAATPVRVQAETPAGHPKPGPALLSQLSQAEFERALSPGRQNQTPLADAAGGADVVPVSPVPVQPSPEPSGQTAASEPPLRGSQAARVKELV